MLKRSVYAVEKNICKKVKKIWLIEKYVVYLYIKFNYESRKNSIYPFTNDYKCLFLNTNKQGGLRPPI